MGKEIEIKEIDFYCHPYKIYDSCRVWIVRLFSSIRMLSNRGVIPSTMTRKKNDLSQR